MGRSMGRYASLMMAPKSNQWNFMGFNHQPSLQSSINWKWSMSSSCSNIMVQSAPVGNCAVPLNSGWFHQKDVLRTALKHSAIKKRKNNHMATNQTSKKPGYPGSILSQDHLNFPNNGRPDTNRNLFSVSAERPQRLHSPPHQCS
jgi:hypothetical protein